MNTRTRWTIGILLALVIGLTVGLVIVAADESDDPDTVTVEATETEPADTETQPTTTETTPEEGGGTAPQDGQPDGSGGLGFD